MTNKKKQAKKKKSETENKLPTGVIRINPRGGFGFVNVDDPAYTEDIFIPRAYTLGAVDGDTVEIRIEPLQSWNKKGPEGKVVTILKRGRTHLAGIVISAGKKHADVHVPLLKSDAPVILSFHKQKLIPGERVIMEVQQWGGKNKPTTAKLAKSLGHISDPSIDVDCAMEEFEIPVKFPVACLQETVKFGTTVPQSEVKNREDLRDLEIFTIDPDTAKDYDDAIHVIKNKKGGFHLGVHIADVSHYVQAGSALDKEAFHRANSTYFPGRCIPMLPSELSDNLCSLKPKVNRLTVSVFMDFDKTGELINYRIARTVIKSAKRFTYREAKEVLDGTKKSPHEKALKLMVELCGLLKKKRFERGSVEFAMPELVVLVDKEGIPTGTDYVEYDITHQLVEEFMLKANETVAKHLHSEGKGLPYRVHDEPSEENMRDFSALANAFGFKLPTVPTPQDIQALFEEAMQSPYGQYLATSYIRRMRLAVYSPVNIGHFGLSLTHYCHFTSPIRRYVDLVAHRLLFENPYEEKLLDKIAEQCSERERISAKAESTVLQLKKMRLLKAMFEKDPKKHYGAVVTRIKPFGMTFEILELMMEGFLHISEIGNDYWEYREATQSLEGDRTGRSFTAGDKIQVSLIDVDLVLSEAKWRIITR